MIQVKNLYKRYGKGEAIKNVSFQVKEGEILGFLGPNGAGKTTTMKILTGFFPPTDGQVEIGGVSLQKHMNAIKRKIGYLPENAPLYTDMRVQDFLKFAARVKGIGRMKRKTAVSLAVEECSLQPVTHRIIKTLSKGYRQRVALAQALLGDPGILILDEPTLGLDPKQIIEIRALIKAKAGKKTVILSTHILPEVSMMCDRVIIINEGRIIAIDSPERLHHKLKSAHEIALLARGNEELVLDLIKAVPHVLNVRVSNRTKDTVECIVDADKNVDIRPALAAAIVKSRRKCELLELKSLAMSLEDIFLKLVTKEDTA